MLFICTAILRGTHRTCDANFLVHGHGASNDDVRAYLYAHDILTLQECTATAALEQNMLVLFFRSGLVSIRSHASTCSQLLG